MSTFATDTIAAIATPPGTGAVALLRISGPASREIAARCLQGREFGTVSPRQQMLGNFCAKDGAVIDQVLWCFFPGPRSYTGEDVVEIACHGGVLVTRRILERLLEAGARAAEPGEFTQRAFCNGKLDLTQAEAVMDLISAQTDLALRAAQEQLSGSLGDAIRQLREDLLGILAHVEAFIDFPEEGIDPDTGAVLQGRIQALASRIAALLATADQGRILREGVRTVLVGSPNAGKSSLLNLLLGFDRAIVSDTAGTTRDTIEETINLRGLPLRLVDTAGLRATADGVEKLGVARTQEQIARADLVLEIVDASQEASQRVEFPADLKARRLLVLNKSDLGLAPRWQREAGIVVSCKTGAGREDLSQAIYNVLTQGAALFVADLTAINARHQNCLHRAQESLDAALAGFAQGLSAEFLAVELRAAMDAIGEVVGKWETEELLDEIFSRFCIGK